MAKTISDYLAQASANPAFLAGLNMYIQSQRGGAGPAAGFAQGLQQYGQANHQQQQLALEQQRAAASQKYMEAMTGDMQDRRTDRQIKRDQEAEQQRLQRETIDRLEASGQIDPISAAIARGFGIQPALSVQRGEQTQEHRAAQLAEQQRQFEERERRYSGQFDKREKRLGENPPGTAPKRKVPTPSYIYEEPLPDGRFQKYKFNERTGQHEPFGSPFKKRESMSDYLDDPVISAPSSAGPQPYNPQPTPGLPGGGGHMQMPPQGRGLLMRPGAGAPPPGQNPQMAQDFAEARQLIQQRPELAPEINRRLMNQYGRGL